MRLVDRHPIDALTLGRGEDDDLDAVAWAERTIRREIARVEPRELHLVTIDGWFSQRWLGFSNKELGAVRFATMALRVPPFVPSRVIAHQCLVRERGGAYVPLPRPPELHRRQPSAANRDRTLAALFPDAALCWWSGGTRSSGRGSLMAYLPGEGGHTAWYAELARGATGAWRVTRTVGVGAAELIADGAADGAMAN
ncbi:MAG: hypothetical protein IPH44_26925 [Myxococcales bacterium]|nr:hypothetical protein [Myxococcales bacterium]MBP6845931.1 hypothetical protein [Kofleriaceae bacterium]